MTSLDRLITKKTKKESTAPVLTVNDAVVKILSAEQLLIGDTVTKNDGDTFTVDRPSVACEMELTGAPKRKQGDVGTTWYEKLFYPEVKDKQKNGTGVYEITNKSKIGKIALARYGEDFFDNEDLILDPEDLVGFTFICNLVPKTEFGGTKVTGTRIDQDSIEALEDEFTPPQDAPDAPDFKGIEGKGK